MTQQNFEAAGAVEGTVVDDEEHHADLFAMLLPLAQHWRSLVLVAFLAGALGTGAAFLIAPIFTAKTLFIPPQQQQSGASSALASLGALASLSGVGSALKNPTDEYVALLGSVTIRDRIIDQFHLLEVYKSNSRDKTREALGKRVQFSIGKKDGLVTVAVEDTDPKRAAAMANQFVVELRRLTSVLAVSEAQGRRMFFEKQLEDTKTRLTAAQVALQDSGFTQGALKAEPRAAAEGYAKLQAELTTAVVTLQTMQQTLADGTPEVQQQLAKVRALREQLRAREVPDEPAAGGPDFVGKYREFKYQETLFELMARQYELARVDESREGALVQVVDPATPPEHKTWPGRLFFGEISALVGAFLYALFLIVRGKVRAAIATPQGAQRWQEFRQALHRR